VANLAGSLLKPADSLDLVVIEFRHIGFYIQQRGAVHYIHVLNIQDILANCDQPHYGKSDGIWPPRRPGGKDPSGGGIKEGHYSQRRVFNQVKVVEQDDMGKAIEIFYPFDVLGEYLHFAANPISPCGLDGHAFNVFEGAFNKADRLKYNKR